MAISTCSVKTTSTGEELVTHGTLSFPIAIYDDYLPGYSVPWHWHEDMEFIFITSGSAIVSVNSREYIIHENEGIFINSSSLHEVHAVGDANAHLKSIVFHPRLVGGNMDSVYWHNYLEPLLRDKQLSHIVITSKKPWHNEVLKKLNSVWEQMYQNHIGYEVYVRNGLSEIILLIHTNHALAQLRPSAQNLRNAERIKTMLQYIHEHYSEEILISSLAAEAFISNSEVLRCFHNMIKTSPTQYIKQYRLQKACILLETTDYNSGKIGIECGFQSSSYFIKTFKDHYGCTPLEYRKTVKK